MNKSMAVTFTSWLVSRIKVSAERRKTANETVVLMLMRSIKRRGLLSPIRVRSDGTLVCGLHRLIAHERLGLEAIEVIVDDRDAVDAELDEIEENLARKELTVLERAIGESRQKVLYLQKYPESRKGVSGALAKHGVSDVQAKALSFAAVHAQEMGSGKRMVEQRVQIADGLSPETIAALLESSIANNHTQLLALARAPEPLRHTVALHLVEHGRANVRAALNVVSGLAAPESQPRARSSLSAFGTVTETRGGLSGVAVLGGRRVRLRLDPERLSFTLRDVGPRLPELLGPVPRDWRALTLALTAEIAAQTIAELPRDLGEAVSPGPLEAKVDPAGRRSPRIVQTLNVRGQGGAARFHVRWLNAREWMPSLPLGTVLLEVDRRRFVLGVGTRLPPAEEVRQALRDALVRALGPTCQVYARLGRLYRGDGTEWMFNRARVRESEQSALALPSP